MTCWSRVPVMRTRQTQVRAPFPRSTRLSPQSPVRLGPSLPVPRSRIRLPSPCTRSRSVGAASPVTSSTGGSDGGAVGLDAGVGLAAVARGDATATADGLALADPVPVRRAGPRSCVARTARTTVAPTASPAARRSRRSQPGSGCGTGTTTGSASAPPEACPCVARVGSSFISSGRMPYLHRSA